MLTTMSHPPANTHMRMQALATWCLPSRRAQSLCYEKREVFWTAKRYMANSNTITMTHRAEPCTSATAMARRRSCPRTASTATKLAPSMARSVRIFPSLLLHMNHFLLQHSNSNLVSLHFPASCCMLQRLLASGTAALQTVVHTSHHSVSLSSRPHCIKSYMKRCLRRCAGYNPTTKAKEQGGGSTGRAGCGKPTNYHNAFSGSGTTPYSKPWCGLICSTLHAWCANKSRYKNAFSGPAPRPACKPWCAVNPLGNWAP
jgi:hypothetical protein